MPASYFVAPPACWRKHWPRIQFSWGANNFHSSWFRLCAKWLNRCFSGAGRDLKIDHMIDSKKCCWVFGVANGFKGGLKPNKTCERTGSSQTLPEEFLISPCYIQWAFLDNQIGILIPYHGFPTEGGWETGVESTKWGYSHMINQIQADI